MRREIVKCFWGNIDGINEGMIVAHNQTEAAKIIGCSKYEFQRYWSSGGFPKHNDPAWKNGHKILKLYTRKYNGCRVWE